MRFLLVVALLLAGCAGPQEHLVSSPAGDCGPQIQVGYADEGAHVNFSVTGVNASAGPWRVADLTYALKALNDTNTPMPEANASRPLTVPPLVVRADLAGAADALDVGDALLAPNGTGNLFLYRGGVLVGGQWMCI